MNATTETKMNKHSFNFDCLDLEYAFTYVKMLAGVEGAGITITPVGPGGGNPMVDIDLPPGPVADAIRERLQADEMSWTDEAGHTHDWTGGEDNS